MFSSAPGTACPERKGRGMIPAGSMIRRSLNIFLTEIICIKIVF
jgi:hypothetical protein